MKRRIMILVFILSSVAVIKAQNPAPTLPPRIVRPTTTAERVNNQLSRESDAKFRQLQELEIPRVRESVNGNVLSDGIQSIYRKPNFW